MKKNTDISGSKKKKGFFSSLKSGKLLDKNKEDIKLSAYKGLDDSDTRFGFPDADTGNVRRINKRKSVMTSSNPRQSQLDNDQSDIYEEIVIPNDNESRDSAGLIREETESRAGSPDNYFLDENDRLRLVDSAPKIPLPRSQQSADKPSSNAQTDNRKAIDSYDIPSLNEENENEPKQKKDNSSPTASADSKRKQSVTERDPDFKPRPRSKSVFTTGALSRTTVNNHNTGITKRRTMIEVLRQIDAPDDPSIIQEDRMRFGSLSPNEMNHGMGFSMNSIGGNHLPSLLSKELLHHLDEKKKRPPRVATGLSVVYGLFLAIVGVFISLDSQSGEISYGSRLPFLIFYLYLYSVSIFWILYLFIDIRRYIKEYNDFVEKNEQGTASAHDVREVYGEIMKSHMNKDSNEAYGTAERRRSSIYATGKKANKLVDFKSKRFNGYMLDNSQAYNMYLKAGIGVFCMVALLQSCVEVAEAIENFSNNRWNCWLETFDAIASALQFIFSSLQFLFIFHRGNMVICSGKTHASIFTMHLAVTNLIVWFKTILLETINEYYEHILEEHLETIHHYNLTVPPLANDSMKIEYIDCHDYDSMPIKSFVTNIISYLYPATIEFSITCATIFLIMWFKIGKTHRKHYSLPPTKKRFEGVGNVKVPYSNLFIMLDCTKTTKGLFFGVLIFVCTLLSFIMYLVYKGGFVPDEEAATVSSSFISGLISELTEIFLLIVALIITWVGMIKVRRNYTKVVPEINAFDIGLEIVSMCGVYAYSINCIIALVYSLFDVSSKREEQVDFAEFLTTPLVEFVNQGPNSSWIEAVGNKMSDRELVSSILALISAVLSLVQGTLQTLFILECLRRYASQNSQLVHKPARELITTLLLTNVSLWFFDTFSAKRFDTKPYLIEHFGILKWSIINAFSSPLALFYRFHSSVCLSDIWYGLYYGEYEKPEIEEEDNFSYEMSEDGELRM